VIAALSRPLTAFVRQRFLSLLALSLIQLLGCLLPLWCLHLIAAPAEAWRLLSVVLLLLNVARLWWLVILPNRELGEEQVILTPFLSKITWSAGFLGISFLAVNSIGIPFAPNFDLYYPGLLSTLIVGFALFADVATRSS